MALPSPFPVELVGLLAPLGFCFILGVVGVDVIVDHCARTEWKMAYYAAHRTAAFPFRAFIPAAMAVALVGYTANVVQGAKMQQRRRREQQQRQEAAAGTENSSSTPGWRDLRDWRSVASGALGCSIFAIFVKGMVPHQDFVAQVTVEAKSLLRTQPQVTASLAVIRRGHLVVGAILAALVVLQLAVALELVVAACVEARLAAMGIAAAGDEMGSSDSRKTKKAATGKVL